MDFEELEKVFGKRYFKELIDDLKKDTKQIMPIWFKTMLKQGLKPIPEMAERMDRMEQKMEVLTSHVDRLVLLYEQQQENYADLKAQNKGLSKSVEKTVKEDNNNLAKSIAKDFEAISERKPKALWKFWKRGKK